MQVLLVVLLLFPSIWAHPGARIIGGQPAEPGQFPYAVSIYSLILEGKFLCGGAIINHSWILTSASCVNGVVEFLIRVGSNDLSSSNDTGVTLTAYEYVVHPDYNFTTLEDDVALIHLQVPLEFDVYVQPVHLPTRELQQYAVVSAIGWGQTGDETEPVDYLHTVKLTALSNDDCRSVYGDQITDEMVCVGMDDDQGTCYGDTGGPLIQYVNANLATVAGVSSFISGNGCGSGDPSGYTRTFPYLDWIKNVTAMES